MGGRALKNTETVRANPRLYLNVYNQVVYKLSTEFPDLVHYLPRKHRTKESHGDIDILIRGDTVELDRDIIQRLFDPNEIHTNDGVWSFDVFNFQVDLVVKRKEYWETTKAFFDQSGLGNLMGKVARNRRTKWGFQGLRYTLYSDDSSKILGEFVLSRDPVSIFDFLGFDYDTFLAGFDTMEDIFEYVVTSKYFNHEMFQPESLTSSQRFRDTKRPAYEMFMQYISDIPPVRLPRMSSGEALDEINTFFPDIGIREKVNQLKEREKLRQEARNKFNGRTIMENFSLSGPELGKAIGKFHNTFSDKNVYYDYVLKTDVEKILSDFKKVNNL